jgi:anthranilate synthase/aminodeoxychorismate synthase-like glutamine amidotransferase
MVEGDASGRLAEGRAAAPLFLIDNFDSFTYNVVHGLAAAGARVEVRRADRADLATIEALAPSIIVISPGPGRPEDATLSLEIVRRFAGRTPILGICLGMQVIAVACGGTVGRAPAPVHGKMSLVWHDQRGLFAGLPSPLSAGRYHSLCVTGAPACLEVAARTEDGVIMGLRHRSCPMAGLQFHPDSFLTPHGAEIMRNAVHGDF